jgi:phosphatidylserine/phosphatidylglycerophosphate/cardiolipin synthase-like enzyme
MRVKRSNAGLTVQAIAGTHVVLLGMHMEQADTAGLLGFAIQRDDLEDDERAWLRGQKAFAATDPGDGIGATHSSRQHPFQTFQWADYSAKPGRQYRYRVFPMRGTPTALVQGQPVTLTVTTESGVAGDHAVTFNRGATASQEYARRFQNRKPSEIGPVAYRWLSRGLLEGVLDFIAAATGPGWSLHGAVYEFQNADVHKALARAAAAGTTVRVLYDAKGAKAANEAAIAASGIGALVKPRTRAPIMHNKFLVAVRNGVPHSVWTGGTNLTENGIYGHANQAHVVRDEAVARAYLEYWRQLEPDPAQKDLRPFTSVRPATPLANLPQGVTPIFSPRQGLSALDWYAALAKGATRGLFMTFAFGMNKRFVDVFDQTDAVLRFALMEKAGLNPAGEAEVARLRRRPNVTVAVGNRLVLNRFENWLEETRNVSGSRNVHYIHTKYMLIDPLGPDPIVVAGSANFSDAATTSNDENMLVIRGQTRVADIYLGEFMRLFTHYAFREFAARPGAPANEARPLTPDDSWTRQGYYTPGADRALRRLYFAGR